MDNYYAPFYQPSYYGNPAQNRQYPQQYQQPVAQPQQSGNGLIWVQGEAGAKSYLVAPGNTVMLMDSENSAFYLKSADPSGMPLPLRVFDYKERTNVNTQPFNSSVGGEKVDLENFITRKEFEDRMAAIISQYQNENSDKVI